MKYQHALRAGLVLDGREYLAIRVDRLEHFHLLDDGGRGRRRVIQLPSSAMRMVGVNLRLRGSWDR